MPVTQGDEHETIILRGMDGSPMLNKQEFALGSLSPTSNNQGAHMLLDAKERESQERHINNIFMRKSSQGSQESRERL